MDIYEALTTTRAMRRLRADPIPCVAQARILDAAIRAPSGGNSQAWRFILVDDPTLIARIAPLYREEVDKLFAGPYSERLRRAEAHPDDAEGQAMLRMARAVRHQAAHWDAIPLLLFAYGRGDRSGSSIYPAVWNAQLAARAEGIGSTLTTLLSARPEVDELLGVPPAAGWRQMACVPLGYPVGRFGVPSRRPIAEVAARNGWADDLGFVAK